MDPSEWLPAASAIAGAFIGAMASPITESMGRTTRRRSLLNEQRLSAYPRFLHAGMRMVDSAREQAVQPSARVPAMTASEERAAADQLDLLVAQVRLLASSTSREKAAEFQAQWGACRAAYFRALVNPSKPSDQLAKEADELKKALDALEAAMRSDLKSAK